MSDPAQSQALVETSDLVVAAIGFTAVLVGSYVAHINTRKIARENSRRDKSIAIYDEFHSEAITRSRRALYDRIHEHKGKTFGEIFDISDRETQISMSLYLHFLEKISVLLDTEIMDEALLKKILGRYFSIWFDSLLCLLSPEPPDSQWADLLTGVAKLERLKR